MEESRQIGILIRFCSIETVVGLGTLLKTLVVFLTLQTNLSEKLVRNQQRLAVGFYLRFKFSS